MRSIVPKELRSTTIYHILVVVTTLVAASVLFSVLEGYPLGNSFYFIILLMTLIGANYTPHTLGGLVLASALAVFSVGIILSFLGQVLGPVAVNHYLVGLKTRRVSRMENHVVICGFSDIAKVLLHNLPKGEVLFVVKEGELVDYLASQGVAAVLGDYVSSEALGKAGVARSRAVIAISPVDAENAFVCLTAKKLAPQVPVIATASSEENMEKLDEVGADHIISPAVLSAKSILDALGPGGISKGQSA